MAKFFLGLDGKNFLRDRVAKMLEVKWKNFLEGGVTKFLLFQFSYILQEMTSNQSEILHFLIFFLLFFRICPGQDHI